MKSVINILGHAGEEHGVGKASTSLISEVLHWPTWAGVLLVVAVLAVVYLLLANVFKLKFAMRLLVVVASTILLGVLYMPHNASVTGIVLSAGFIATFLLTFTLLGKPSN